ncbi:MAG: DUF4255 domain-containing protein [Synechococcales bacterium]|nr:DUF4255 domain-containing protein [Synechococcales bacterium]
MSNELAIAAVTTTLRNLISQSIGEALGSGIVTTRPPDKARENGEATNQINVFLYQTHINPHWRNRDIPIQVRPGETGRSPLPLNLCYLITAYGQDNDDVAGHRLLGGAMRILHDNTILSREAIRTALPESDLHNQIEKVRITPIEMNLEEISKLWTTFQTQYRISAAYEVSVVLIDSAVPARTPLPVLLRGNDDRGIQVQADLLPPCPTLDGVELPNQQDRAQLGDRLILRGYRLESDSGQVQVLFRHPRLDEPVAVVGDVQPGGEAIAVTLPDAPAPWLAGFYTLTVQLQQAGRAETSNAISLAIAPRITAIDRVVSEEGNPLLRLISQPEVQASQQVAVLIGGRAIALLRPSSPPARTRTLDFPLGNLSPGDYWLRLRVDGVDSLLVDRTTTPPRFDPRWRLRLP